MKASRRTSGAANFLGGKFSNNSRGSRFSQRFSKAPARDGEDDDEAKIRELAARLSSANQGEHRLKVIDPEDSRYRLWLALMVVLGFYSACEASFTIAFFSQFQYYSVLPLAYIIDALFVANVYISMHAGYFDASGAKVLDGNMVMRRYLRSFTGLVEMIAVIPTDFVQLGTGWTPIARVTKILRLLPLSGQLTIISRTSVMPRIINLVTVVRMGLVWLVTSHLAACVRVLFAAVEGYGSPETDTWNLDESLEGAPPAKQYLHSLYWCMGLMTGMADGSLPRNEAQFFFTIALITSGAFIFAFSVGAIGSLDEMRVKKSEQSQLDINAMQRFLTRYPLPPELIQAITDYYHYNLKQEAIGALTTSAHMLEELPLALRCEAVRCITQDALDKVPLFSSAEEGFMIALTQKMLMAIACPNELLAHPGVPTSSMYVVLRGMLEVYTLKAGPVLNTLTEGSVFGEQSLLTEEPAVAYVASVSYCVLYQLKKDDFDTLSKEFVKTFEGFRQAARLAAKDLKKKAGGPRLKKMQTSGNLSAQAAAAAAPAPAEESVVSGNGGAENSLLSHADDDVAHQANESERGTCSLFDTSTWKRFVVLPKSTERGVWAFFILMAISYDGLALPIKLAFVGNALDPGLVACDVIADVIFLGDAFLRFYVAILADGRLVTDRAFLRKRYRKVGFWPNLVGSIPLSPLLLAWPAADARALQAPRVLRLCRLLWRIRATKAETLSVKQQPSNLEELLRVFRSSPFDLQFAKTHLLPLLFMYIVLAHYAACGYWAIVLLQVPQAANSTSAALGTDAPLIVGGAVLPEGNELPEWLPSRSLLTTGNVWQWYYRSLYFSVSTLTGLGKDLVPSADATIVFTVVVFIIGVLVFAYITSAIVMVVNQADVSARLFQRKKIGLLAYMHDANIDRDIIFRAGHWLDHYWQAHGAVRIDQVLDALTPSLKHRIKLHIFGLVTAKVPLFRPQGTSDGYPHLPIRCLERLADAIVFEVYNPGEWVLHKGMLAESFYIIAHGEAQVLLDENNGVVISLLARGDCFGEHSALRGSKCGASVRAKETLELLAISRASLLAIIEKHGEFKERLDEVERRRTQENRFIMRWGEKIKDVKAEGITATTLLEQCRDEQAQRVAVQGTPGRRLSRRASADQNNAVADVLMERESRVAKSAEGGEGRAGSPMGWQHMKRVATMLNEPQHLSKEWTETLTLTVGEVAKNVHAAAKSVKFGNEGGDDALALPPAQACPPSPEGVRPPSTQEARAPSGSESTRAGDDAPAPAPSVSWFKDQLQA